MRLASKIRVMHPVKIIKAKTKGVKDRTSIGTSSSDHPQRLEA